MLDREPVPAIIRKAPSESAVDELEQEIARRIYDLGRNGGYILAPCHNIGHDIPPENVVTLFERARELGRDPMALQTMAEGGGSYFAKLQTG